MLEVKNLTKRYRKTIAVNDFSFKFEKGKVYAIVGADGAGKSTMLGIMSGYLLQNDGSVIINKYDINKDSKKAKKEIGFMPENAPLYDNMTVREHLDFIADIKGVSGDKKQADIERVTKAAAIVDIENKLIKKLSYKEKKCVGFAQTLIGNPEIIILDDIFAGLDANQTEVIKKEINNLKAEHTIIISSSILGEVSGVCDEIIIISNGKMIANDTPENLKKLLGDTEEVIVTIVGKTDKASSLLRKMSEVKKVEGIGKDSDGHNMIKVDYVPAGDINEAITEALTDSKITIVNIEKKEVSFEELILKDNSEKESSKESDGKSNEDSEKASDKCTEE